MSPDLQLATNAYVTGENGGSVVVTVNRLNVNTGAVSVNYSTSDGSAVAGVDYVATNGVLKFADGQASTNVTITILNPDILENSKTFNFALSNPRLHHLHQLLPAGALQRRGHHHQHRHRDQLLQPGLLRSAKAVCRRRSPSLRSGVTNTSVSVQFATADGTGHAGTNYFATSGTLTFAPGVTSPNFPVNIIDDHIITADHTVVLSLGNPQGGAILGSPSTAILTIQECDGAYIIAAGTSLVSRASSHQRAD